MMDMDTLRTQWHEHLRATRAPGTVVVYMRILRGFTRWLVSHDHEEIDQQNLQAWIDHLSREELAPATIRLRVAAVREFAKYCDINVPRLRLPRVPETEGHALTDDQLAEFLERAHKLRNRVVGTLLYLLPHTGLRVGVDHKIEALGLRRSSLERRGDGWWIRVQGKGKRERGVPLDDDVITTLRNYLKFWWKGELTDRLFPVSYDAVHGAVARIRKQMGLPWLKPHTLRHTYATRLLDRGVDVMTIQELLGHSSVTTTMRYLHSTDSKKRAAVELLRRRAS